MVFVGEFFRLGITFALLGVHVDYNAVPAIARIGESLDKFFYIVTVYRTVIFYPVFPERLSNGIQIAQIFRNAADVFGYGHIVVVDYSDKFLSDSLYVVERLVNQTARHCAVAYQSDYLRSVVSVPEHTARKRRRRGGMPRISRVIYAFFTLGETGYTVFGAQRGEFVLAAGKNFMCVTLVSHVKNQPVFFEIEYVMQGHRKFHHSQI